MSSLTENERLGLEEVFLSISTNRRSEKGTFLKGAGRLFRKKEKSFQHLHIANGVLNRMKKRIKLPYFAHLFVKSGKKKKNLS